VLDLRIGGWCDVGEGKCKVISETAAALLLRVVRDESRDRVGSYDGELLS